MALRIAKADQLQNIVARHEVLGHDHRERAGPVCAADHVRARRNRPCPARMPGCAEPEPGQLRELAPLAHDGRDQGLRAWRLCSEVGRPWQCAELCAADHLGPEQHGDLFRYEPLTCVAGMEHLWRVFLLPCLLYTSDAADDLT